MAALAVFGFVAYGERGRLIALGAKVTNLVNQGWSQADDFLMYVLLTVVFLLGLALLIALRRGRIRGRTGGADRGACWRWCWRGTWATRSAS